MERHSVLLQQQSLAALDHSCSLQASVVCFMLTAGMPLRPTLSFGRGREGLVTPGGSDLMAVVNRNADKLRVLENMPETGSTEALDQFLSTFVAQTSQVRT